MWNSQYNNYPEVYIEDPAFANPYAIPLQQNNYEQTVPQPIFTNGPAFSPEMNFPVQTFQQPYVPYTIQPQQSFGMKKALLIGINYLDDPKSSLSGAISDVRRMKEFLVNRGFIDSPSTIVMLTDDQTDPNFRPTKQNIINAMNWLIGGVNPGDSLFFQFSGHGGQQTDANGDEEDGLDETILPVDFRKAGVITDDQLHDYLVKPLPFGSRLTAVMDSCHSGTGMDLPFSIGRNNSVGSPYSPESKSSSGDVILFSGCRDDQTSADTTISTKHGKYSGGAMTLALLDTLSKLQNPTYAQILHYMRETMNKYTQEVQLSSGKPIDVNQIFLL